MAKSEFGQINNIGHLQLGHQCVAMFRYRIDADKESFADLFGLLACDQ